MKPAFDQNVLVHVLVCYGVGKKNVMGGNTKAYAFEPNRRGCHFTFDGLHYRQHIVTKESKNNEYLLPQLCFQLCTRQ